jgi:hypothetical protein
MPRELLLQSFIGQMLYITLLTIEAGVYSLNAELTIVLE